MPRTKYIENHVGNACVNITGDKSGKLTALKPCPPPTGKTGRNQYWLCACSCGGEHVAQGRHIVAGLVTQCVSCR